MEGTDIGRSSAMKLPVTIVLALAFAVPAVAGQNLNIAMYLYSSATGVGGTNHLPTPAPGTVADVFVCLDDFGPGGGMLGAQWRFVEAPGPAYESITNLRAALGGLTLGVPNDATGIAMTTGPAVYPNANGVVVLARAHYRSPESGAPAGGSIHIVPYVGYDGGVVMDVNNNYDVWREHTVLYDGISSHFTWDPASPVQVGSWGSIKALYR